MTPQAIFLGYRLAAASPEEWHARIISCDVPSLTFDGIELWPTSGNGKKWAVFEATTERKVQIQVPVSDEIPGDPPPPGTESVYESDRFVDDAPMEERVLLMTVGNCQFITISGDCSDFQIPFFLSTGFPTTPATHSVTVSIQVQDIRSLPDVADYHERMEGFASSGDKYDRMEYPLVSHNIPLPLKAYLPGTLCLADGRETIAVYRLEEWIGPQTARVILYCADGSVEPTAGSTLIRRRRSQNGVFRQCIIGQVLHLNST